LQCNNPLTKEPKLEAAVRIVGEWPEYDMEIKSLQEDVESNVAHSDQSTAKDSGSTEEDDAGEHLSERCFRIVGCFSN